MSGGFPREEFESFGSDDQRAEWLTTTNADLADFRLRREELEAERVDATQDVQSLETQLALLNEKKTSLTSKLERLSAEVVDVERATHKRSRQLRHATYAVAVSPVVAARAIVAPCVPMEVDLESTASTGALVMIARFGEQNYHFSVVSLSGSDRESEEEPVESDSGDRQGAGKGMFTRPDVIPERRVIRSLFSKARRRGVK